MGCSCSAQIESECVGDKTAQSKRKGLSLDEKRDRMLDYFHEKSSVFTVQQLEKGCSKEKGIVAQSVKDVLKTLCDDDLVMFDKIGGKNFYWSFPSEVALVMRRKEETLKEAVVGLKRKREKLEEKQDSAIEGREDTEERRCKLQKLSELQASVHELKLEVSQFAAMDPEVLADKEKQTKEFLNHANRWTDNIFAVREYCRDKFCIEPARFDGNFGTGDLDYVE